MSRVSDSNESNVSTDTSIIHTKQYFMRDRKKKKCCKPPQSIRDFDALYDIIFRLNLTPHERDLILIRFLHIIDKLKSKYVKMSCWYTSMKSCLTIGGIITPALLAISGRLSHDENVSDTVDEFVYWTTFGISVITGMITSFMTWCRTEKKYFLYYQFTNRVQQCLWDYITLTGCYKTHTDGSCGTHSSMLRLFLSKLESLNKSLNTYIIDTEMNDDNDDSSKFDDSTSVVYNNGTKPTSVHVNLDGNDDEGDCEQTFENPEKTEKPAKSESLADQIIQKEFEKDK